MNNIYISIVSLLSIVFFDDTQAREMTENDKVNERRLNIKDYYKKKIIEYKKLLSDEIFLFPNRLLSCSGKIDIDKSLKEILNYDILLLSSSDSFSTQAIIMKGDNLKLYKVVYNDEIINHKDLLFYSDLSKRKALGELCDFFPLRHKDGRIFDIDPFGKDEDTTDSYIDKFNENIINKKKDEIISSLKQIYHAQVLENTKPHIVRTDASLDPATAIRIIKLWKMLYDNTPKNADEFKEWEKIYDPDCVDHTYGIFEYGFNNKIFGASLSSAFYKDNEIPGILIILYYNLKEYIEINNEESRNIYLKKINKNIDDLMNLLKNKKSVRKRINKSNEKMVPKS